MALQLTCRDIAFSASLNRFVWGIDMATRDSVRGEPEVPCSVGGTNLVAGGVWQV
jgi:hypothetical protein